MATTAKCVYTLKPLRAYHVTTEIQLALVERIEKRFPNQVKRHLELGFGQYFLVLKDKERKEPKRIADENFIPYYIAGKLMLVPLLYGDKDPVIQELGVTVEESDGLYFEWDIDY